MASLGRRAALMTGLLAASLLAAAPAGIAARDSDIIRTGSCSAATDWKLKLSEEDGRIEVEYEVDQNRNGQTWNVRLKRNGNTFWRGQRVTRSPSGSFEVRRVISNGAGLDRIKGIATNPRTGEVCRGSAVFS